MKTMRIIGTAVAALVATLLAAQPAAAAPTQATTRPGLDRAAAWDCAQGYSCYYDDIYGEVKLFTAARCGWHDLRGGSYQNRISSVANYTSGWVRVWIWRNAGYWEQHGYLYPGGVGYFDTNDIDAIDIDC
ncbi:hypothetical protein [Catenuloplanes atrovinosus]|uniref:Peptidase inhibitor family I36 n=1 Tax=Catenuloplanes atrovinosus TaxID=137266 RepID=A0AAE4CAG0_9ACTN|nr:hypothetical protein [Catenuloplanes atrovinosus]MDR7277018.1 hypothetical protein [Catenuloplanes atrovinosus]